MIVQLFEGMVIKHGVIHMLEILMPELSTQFAKIENNHAKIKQLTETIDKTQKICIERLAWEQEEKEKNIGSRSYTIGTYLGYLGLSRLSSLIRNGAATTVLAATADAIVGIDPKLAARFFDGGLNRKR